jgi:hypothetical protein
LVMILTIKKMYFIYKVLIKSYTEEYLFVSL